jgi:hypothetical protein
MSGRVVRLVPKNFEHPKDGRGRFIPLFNGLDYERKRRSWLEQNQKWDKDPSIDSKDWEYKWVRKQGDEPLLFSEWGGDIPRVEDYTSVRGTDNPSWFMMYEECSEGTPLSPAFETVDELAQYLAEQNTSIFGNWCSNSKAEWVEIIGEPWKAYAVFYKPNA